MALQIATCLSSEDAIATVDSALNRRMLTLVEISQALADSRKSVSDVLESLDPNSQSGLESLCRVRLGRIGLATRSQVLVEGVGHVDLIIGDRLVIETDGKEWHDSPEAFARDRDRDLRLALLGYRVVRLTYAQVIGEWALVELSIRSLVARGEHLWP